MGHMKRLAAITVLIWACASAQATTAVQYSGPSPAGAGALERRIGMMRIGMLQPAVLADSLKLWLGSEGYLDAQVAISGDSVTIAAGPQYHIKALALTDSTEILRPAHGVFSQPIVDKILSDLLAEYQARGFYYARLSITGISTTGDSVIIHVSASKGPAVTIAGNLYQGVTRTRADLLSRYLPRPGDNRLTDSTVEKAGQAAGTIPFLDFAPPVVVRPRSGYTQADLEYNFSERKQFVLFGGAGYLPDKSGGLIWNVDLKLRNLFGDGKEAAIQSERRDRGHNLLSVTYGQPTFLVGLGWFNANILTRDYRDQFYEFGLTAGYTTRITPRLNTGVTLGWKRVDPTNGLDAYRRLTAEFDIAREALDNRFNPTSGTSLKASLTYDYRKYSADSLDMGVSNASFNETRSRLSFTWYQHLIGPLVSSAGVNYIGFETGEKLPPVSELILVGGPGTLRGFRNEQFAAQRTAFGSVEPHIRFTSGYFFMFYDAAYLNYSTADSSGSVSTSELYRYGFGGGLALTSGERAVKLSLAWNRDLAFDQPWLSVEFSSGL